MLRNKILLGIILSIILLVFSISGFAAYYKYTQESGTNFYVGTADKSDALEDTNEVRQILDDLGSLLGHSKRDDLYPKNGTTRGYLGRLNYGLDASKPAVPVANDMYLATDTVEIYRCFVAGNWVKVYPGAGGITTFLELTDTPASYTGKEAEILWVNTSANGIEFSGITIETTLTVDSNYEIPTSKAVNDFCETTKNYMQELEDDPCPTLGNDLVLNTHSIFIDVELTSDHTYTGLFDQQVVGEIVSFGDLLYFDWTTKKWKKADADSNNMVPGLKIALEDQIADLPCYMLVMGYIRDDDWDFTGAMIYASATAGAMTSTAPSTTGQQIQRVGQAKSADVFFFNPSCDVGEI